MAAPRLALAVVLILAVITLTEGIRGFGPKKCCSGYNKKPANTDRVVSYTRTSQRCAKPAILLLTVGGDELCARPSAAWVKKLTRDLDAKSVRAGETSNL